MAMWTLTLKRVISLSMDHLALYNCYSTCPEDSKYPIGQAVDILVSEKKIFEIWPNFTPCGALSGRIHTRICTTIWKL